MVCLFFTYPGSDLDVPERIGEDCGRDWLDPAMLDEEEEEEEEPNNPELLLDERENGPGKLSSMMAKIYIIQTIKKDIDALICFIYYIRL